MAASRGSRSRSSPSRGSSRPRGRGSEPSRHRGLGILFWICLVAVVIFVAIAAREPLKAAFAQLRGKPPAPGGAPTAAPVTPGPPAAPAGARSRETPRVTIAPLTEGERSAENPGAPAAPSAVAPRPPTAASSSAARSPSTPEHPAARKARLYFVSIDSAGRIVLKSVIRSIPASDSPLKDTLESLLKGPTGQELNLGLISMIPTEARLRSVVVRDDTAIVDFTESFRFNAQGMDAMDAQLRQVVYAATEFPSVRKVQILIEGAAVRYLGTEGMRLDAPLTRDSFQ
jgi:germination protein M